LKVKEFSSVTDYFVILSGSSDRQVKALASWLEESLAIQGIFPLGIEGKEYGHWILMDYEDIVVHIFYHPSGPFMTWNGYGTKPLSLSLMKMPQK
jgi:ribosome-associated protein